MYKPRIGILTRKEMKSYLIIGIHEPTHYVSSSLSYCSGAFFAFGRYVTRIPNVILGILDQVSLWVNGFTGQHALPRITVSKAFLLL
jgi:hypothetical protein